MLKKQPIEIKIVVKQGNEIKSHNFKIFGEIDYERMNELDEIPKTPNNRTDYWKVAELLCKKDAGRLPTVGELAIISGLQETKILNTQFYGRFWSSSEVSATMALKRNISSSASSWGAYSRNVDNFVPLCVGD